MKMSDAMARLHGELRYEPTEKRIRAELGGHLVVDTTRALLVWEPRRIVPAFAVPEEDLWARLGPAQPADPTPDEPEILYPGIPFAVHSTDGEPLTLTAHGETRTAAAFRPADPDLHGHVVLDFDALDRWYEEDEPLRSHPRDPYHRVDVRASSRHVRMAFRGRPVVDTTRPTLVYETSVQTRFYVPREDVVESLEPSDTRTYCPYKGEASYFSIAGTGGTAGKKDVAWSYEHPLHDVAPIEGLIAFYDDVMEVTVDGVRRDRPDTPGARAMRAAFGV